MSDDDRIVTAIASPLVGRRRILLGLATVIPATRFLRPGAAWAQTGDDQFLTVSRIVTGSDEISADVADRIQMLLTDRVEGFGSKLTDLARVMQDAGDSRDAQLGGLSDDQVAFALQIAMPWYLGYVGKPSSFVLDDNAAFTTFLQAQAWEKIVGEVPRPTYPDGGVGWWTVPPPGVTTPAMPDEITSWTYHPAGPSGIMPPDPIWKAYATAKHDSIDAARTKKPDAGASSGNN